jgi:hypothetical protein
VNQWKPIETCPFVDGLEIWVTDGKRVSPIVIDRRFGMPLWIYEMGDSAPKFLQEWAFSDQDAPKNYCSSGPLPDDQIGYIPTHWAPRWAPAAPSTP